MFAQATWRHLLCFSISLSADDFLSQ